MEFHPFSVGQIVRPAFNGEDRLGSKLAWTKLKGKIVSVWTEGGFDAWENRTRPVVHKVKVTWFQKAPYPKVLEHDWVVAC